jgi:hypothetical protein
MKRHRLTLFFEIHGKIIIQRLQEKKKIMIDGDVLNKAENKCKNKRRQSQK